MTYNTKIITDDWPYIYLESPQIPVIYWFLTFLMILLLLSYRLFLRHLNLITNWHSSHWHFFFLGAAFLLLEVQNISKASVALGNTWEVNGVIISGVLVMILLANLVTAKFPRIPLMVVYSFLIGTCAGLYFIDLASFAFFPYAVKALIIGSLTTFFMFFGGIVFMRSFSIVKRKDTALGANLIGALVGALLQLVTFITGIKALLLIVTGFYFIALLTRPKIIIN